MKASTLHLIIALALALLPGMLAAQGNAQAHTRIADGFFQRMAYAQAKAEYQKAADLGAMNEHVVKRLAECSMKLGDTRDGEIWYAQVVKFLNREPMDLYMYAQALKGNGKYAEAEEWMDRYLGMTQTQGEARKSNIVDFANKFTSSRDRFTVGEVSCNSDGDDMGAAWDGTDRVIFCSARDTTVGIQWRSAWDDRPFMDLYRAQRQPNGDLVGAVPLPGNVNSKFHDGPAVVAPDGSLWYTRTSSTRSKNNVQRLSILHAARDGDGWRGSDPFLYNNPECSVGHPAISADGRWFFFASDMPGGYGGTDIYVCEDRGGQWGEPRNLGPGVNTAGNELFPFMAADGTLYFASTGLPGLGGLDIFASQRGVNGEFAFAMNVGAPVNGPKDDFGFIIDASNTKGYFSSNRPGGLGGDDLYSFIMHYPLEQQFLCTGTVFDDDTGEPMPDVEMTLLDSSGAMVASGRSDAQGRYSFPVKENAEYAVRAIAPGHYDGLAHLGTADIRSRQIVARDVHLVPDAGIWLRGAVRYRGVLGFAEGVKVSVVNLSSFFSDVHTTGAGGDFMVRLQPNEQFEVVFEKPDYFSMSVPVSTKTLRRGVIELGEVADLRLDRVQIGRAMPMKYVRWSGGDNTLSPQAKAELDQLADRIQVNPTLHFEVTVHAGTKMAADAALALTKARAKVVEDYLRSKGIRKDHLTVTGMGITKPLNPCGPGVECTDGQHAQNERVEYAVTGVDGL